MKNANFPCPQCKQEKMTYIEKWVKESDRWYLITFLNCECGYKAAIRSQPYREKRSGLTCPECNKQTLLCLYLRDYEDIFIILGERHYHACINPMCNYFRAEDIIDENKYYENCPICEEESKRQFKK